MEELFASDLRKEKATAVGESVGIRLTAEDSSNKVDDQEAVLKVVRIPLLVERFGVNDLCVMLVSVTTLGIKV